MAQNEGNVDASQYMGFDVNEVGMSSSEASDRADICVVIIGDEDSVRDDGGVRPASSPLWCSRCSAALLAPTAA